MEVDRKPTDGIVEYHSAIVLTAACPPNIHWSVQRAMSIGVRIVLFNKLKSESLDATLWRQEREKTLEKDVIFWRHLQEPFHVKEERRVSLMSDL